MRALDNIGNIPTGQLKQRRHELVSELATVDKKNIPARVSIILDYKKVIDELYTR